MNTRLETIHLIIILLAIACVYVWAERLSILQTKIARLEKSPHCQSKYGQKYIAFKADTVYCVNGDPEQVWIKRYLLPH